MANAPRYELPLMYSIPLTRNSIQLRGGCKSLTLKIPNKTLQPKFDNKGNNKAQIHIAITKYRLIVENPLAQNAATQQLNY